MTHFAELTIAVAAVAHGEEVLDVEAHPLNLVRLRDLVIGMQRELRVHAEAIEQALIECIDAQGDIVLSDTERLYVGQTKTTKSVDDQGILMAILEAGGGNLELLTTGDGGMLASQPWKAGAVRNLIGDDKFSACFETTVKIDVKTGKPARSVKVADQRFGA